jgi:hypothetical protein
MLSGVLPWDLAMLELKTGDRVRYRLEAQDSKGQWGRSEKQSLDVAGGGLDDAADARALGAWLAAQETLDGWMAYVAGICRLAKEALGTEGQPDAGFTLEVWNEYSFGSNFLDINRYYEPGHSKAASRAFDRVFKEKQLPEEIPPLTLPTAELEDGMINLVRLLRLAGCASSNSIARRLIEQGGVSLGADAESLEVIDDFNAQAAVPDGTILKVGKRRFFRLGTEHP